MYVHTSFVLKDTSIQKEYILATQRRALGKQEGNDKFRAYGKNPVYAYLS